MLSSSVSSNIPHLLIFILIHRFLTTYIPTYDFHSNLEIPICKTYFSSIHCNIQGLQGNYNNLINIFGNLKFNFSIIGLSEIKTKRKGCTLTNVSIPGCYRRCIWVSFHDPPNKFYFKYLESMYHHHLHSCDVGQLVFVFGFALDGSNSLSS